MKTASLYIRRSKASIDGETVSLAFQEEDLRRLAAHHGAEVVKVFIDDGRSGANLKRKAWLDWIASASEVDLLLTWAIDRSARGDAVMSLYPIMTALAAHKVRLLTVRDRLDSDDPRFERDVLWEAQRASEDWKTISARNLRVRQAKRDKGEWVGPAPFGTRLEDKRLVIDDEETAIVREVASRLLRGDPIATTARWLNSTGVKTRRGNLWTRSTLKSNLSSASVRDVGVLDLATYKAVQTAIHPRKGGGSGRTGGRPPSGLLVGIAICAGCRQRIYRYQRTGGPASGAVYKCCTQARGQTCPSQGRIRVTVADAEIEAAFMSEPIASAFWFEERIQIVGGTLDQAQRDLEAAEARLMADKTMENFLAAQAAEEAIKTASPGERQRTMVPLGTYGERWMQANATRGPDETDQERSLRLDLTRSLVSSLAREIRIGRGGVIEIDWFHDDDPMTNE